MQLSGADPEVDSPPRRQITKSNSKVRSTNIAKVALTVAIFTVTASLGVLQLII